MITTKAPAKATLVAAGMLSACVSEAEADLVQADPKGHYAPLEPRGSSGSSGDGGDSSSGSTDSYVLSEVRLTLPSGYKGADVSQVTQGKFAPSNLPHVIVEETAIFQAQTGVPTRVSFMFNDGSSLKMDITVHDGATCQWEAEMGDVGVAQQIDCY